MVEHSASLDSLRRFHRALSAFAAGGPADGLRAAVTEDVYWDVPGRSGVAGSYEGPQAVVELFARARSLAAGRLRFLPGTVLSADDQHIVVMADGVGELHGQRQRWTSFCYYALREGRVAACFLFPADPPEFDRMWAQSPESSAPPAGR